MDGIVTWVLAGFGLLLLVAISVAWAEHLARQDQLRAPPAPAPAPQRAVSVDVSLDALAAMPAVAASAGDAASRRDMLDGVLERMAQRGGGVTDSRRGWVDTAPMIGLGLAAAAESNHGAEAAEPAPVQRR